MINSNYQKNQSLWGAKPTIMLTMFRDKFTADGVCLDLGCGQGRDALYLAKQGFKVVAVDSSAIAIEQLKEKIKIEGLTNIEAICSDVRLFEIVPEKYNAINAINVLQFLPHEESLKLLLDAKQKIAKGGLIIIKAFTTNDSGFIKTRDNINKTFFNPNELKDLFKDLNILHYFEYINLDMGHGEGDAPHLHGLVELVAQK